MPPNSLYLTTDAKAADRQHAPGALLSEEQFSHSTMVAACDPDEHGSSL